MTNAEALQSDGKDVVVGTLLSGSDLLTDFADVTRLNADGTVDTTFGTNGVVTLPGQSKDEGQAVAIQSNGDIVAANLFTPGTGTGLQEVGVYRLNADGTPDTSFGTGGQVLPDFPDHPGDGQR